MLCRILTPGRLSTGRIDRGLDAVIVQIRVGLGNLSRRRLSASAPLAPCVLELSFKKDHKPTHRSGEKRVEVSHRCSPCLYVWPAHKCLRRLAHRLRYGYPWALWNARVSARVRGDVPSPHESTTTSSAGVATVNLRDLWFDLRARL